MLWKNFDEECLDPVCEKAKTRKQKNRKHNRSNACSATAFSEILRPLRKKKSKQKKTADKCKDFSKFADSNPRKVGFFRANAVSPSQLWQPLS